MSFKHVKEEFDKLSVDDFQAKDGSGLGRWMYWHLRLQFEIYSTLDAMDAKLRKLAEEGGFQKPYGSGPGTVGQPGASAPTERSSQQQPAGGWDDEKTGW